MKKFSKIIVAILLVSILAVSLFACVDTNQDKEGSMTLVLYEGDYSQEFTVNLKELADSNQSNTGLIAVLDFLKDKGLVTYTADATGMLSQVNEVKNHDNHYVYLYTDLEKDFDLTEYASTIEYKGKSYNNSGVGAKDMSIVDGCTIVISTIAF